MFTFVMGVISVHKITPTYSSFVVLLQGIGFAELLFVPVREIALLSSSPPVD